MHGSVFHASDEKHDQMDAWLTGVTSQFNFGSVDAPPSEAKQAEKAEAKQAAHAMRDYKSN